MTSLFGCCAGSRRHKHLKQKASSSPGNQSNGQSRHGDVTTTSGLTRTPSLHNYCLTSSDDQLTSGQSVTDNTVTGATAGSVDKPVRTSPGRVGFVTSPGSSSERHTSALSRHKDTSYCPDDYDNTASDDHDDVTSRPMVQHADLPTEKSSQHPSAPSTSRVTPRTTIKSSEEESLDKLVAHLLGEVSPACRAAAGQSSRASDGQPTASDSEALSSLRWPQGDSLPRLETRRTAAVRDYDVPTSGKLVNEESLADENDNVVKNVSHDLSRSEVSAPADLPHTPPLLVIRKKATATTEPDVCSGDMAKSTDCKTLEELVSKPSTATGSDSAGKDEHGTGYSVSSNHSTEHELLSNDEMSTTQLKVTAQQLSYTESLHEGTSHCPQNMSELRNTSADDAPQKMSKLDEISGPHKVSELDQARDDGGPHNVSEFDKTCDDGGSQNVSKLRETSADGGVVSALCVDVQQPSLLDQFKSLRLEVLTSTSQLLSCVSGTWKRGESFRSKLTTIMQLCLTLRTSVGRLEVFLQSALSTAVHDPLVDTANTRLRNLQAVQTSIDAYIETLDSENLSGTADKSDLKVGGIIHLTKEIPGLVRTFAPVVEYLATAPPAADAAVTTPHEPDEVSDGTEENLHGQNPADTDAVSESLQQKEQQENTDNQDDATLNLPEDNAVVSVVSLGATQCLQTQREHETYPAVEQIYISSTVDNKSDISQSLQTDNEQTSYPTISDSIQEVQSALLNVALSHSSSAVYREDAKNSVVVSGSEREATNPISESEHKSHESLRPVLMPAEVDSESPPTPPPKLRVASLYHASLGITNSLSATSSPAATTTGRYDDDVITTTRSSVDEDTSSHDQILTDKLQQTNWQSGDHVMRGSSEVRTTSETNNAAGRVDEVADRTHNRFPRLTETTSSSQQSDVVLRRRPVAEQEDVDVDDRQCRVSESELETPEFRASGVSQTVVDQLEALQRQANAQAVVMHTDSTAGYDCFNTPSAHHQSTLSAEDRRLLMFYCDQMTGHWNVLDNAASAFFYCMDRRRAPKVFVSHSKFVIVAGHKMAYLGDVLARSIEDSNAQDWIVAHSNRLCTSLKTTVRATKEAALAYPSVPEQQAMVDLIKEVTDWAIELKEVVDRLVYTGRPDYILT